MAKGYQGRHKGDVAIDNAMRDARNAQHKERKGIIEENAISQCMSTNKKKITYKEPKKDIALTAAIANGYDPKKDTQSASSKRIAARKKEAELVELSEQTGIPIEALRKNPNLKPLNWNAAESEQHVTDDED